MNDNGNQELSLIRLFRMYLPKYIKMLGFFGAFHIIYTAALLLEYFGGFANEGVTVANIFVQEIKSWLLISLLYALIMMFIIYQGRSYYSVFFQKGYCEECAEAYKHATIDSKPGVAMGARISLSVIYDNIDMPEKVDELFDGIDFTMLRSKTEKRLYYNNRMALLLAQYRTQEAYTVYNEAAVFMGDTFTTGSDVQKAALDDTYLELLFQMGKYTEAMRYFELVIKPKYTKISHKLLRLFSYSANPMSDGAGMMGIIYTTIACGSIINGYPDDAAKYERLAIQEIERRKHYDFAWQKKYCIDRVSSRIAKAREYAERMNNTDGSAEKIPQ